MQKLLLILISAFMFGGPGAAKADPGKSDCTPEVQRGLTAEQRRKNVEAFETVWQTVRDTHYDPKLGGVNWQEVHQELRPQIEKADTMAEARKVMGEMLGRLGHSHVGIIPAELYEGDAIKGKTGQALLQAGP